MTIARNAEPTGFDVVGDVHGYAEKLVGLLDKLGYELLDGAWQHPTRQAIFVGDLIDRGPQQVRCVQIVRDMVAAGSAQIVLGNHEFNAIAWATPDPEVPGEYLRPHGGEYGADNLKQHQLFLDQVGPGSPLHHELIAWFKTIPLWLDLGELRIIHACWNAECLRIVQRWVSASNSMTYPLIVEGTRQDSPEFIAVEVLLKGPEIPLPSPLHYLDKDGKRREKGRSQWWDVDATTLRRAVRIPRGAKMSDGQPFPELPDDELPATLQPYLDAVPVIFGHYWYEGKPAKVGPTAACVDYSAGNGGDLVAYQWNSGDKAISDEQFVAY